MLRSLMPDTGKGNIMRRTVDTMDFLVSCLEQDIIQLDQWTSRPLRSKSDAEKMKMEFEKIVKIFPFFIIGGGTPPKGKAVAWYIIAEQKKITKEMRDYMEGIDDTLHSLWWNE